MLLSILLFVLYVIGGLMNNVGVQMMAYYMPIFPSFLLYGTTILYILMFFVSELFLEIYNKLSLKEIRERWLLNRNRPLIRVTILLGILTAANGVLSQSALPFVDPLLTSILVQISAPITWLFYPLILRKKYELGQILTFFIIIGGLLFSSLYSYVHGSGSNTEFSNSAFWILITILSAIPTSFETIYQEVAYDSMQSEGTTLILIVLVYYNLISVFVYIAWIFITTNSHFGTCLPQEYVALPLQYCQGNATACSLNQLWPQQRNATLCYVGYYDIECCGGMLATLWTTIFSFGYYLSFMVGAVILKNYGSNTLTNLNALLVPLTGICFWIQPIVGEFYSNFEWWIVVALVSITIGTVLYEYFERKPILLLDPICLPWYKKRYKISKDNVNDTESPEDFQTSVGSLPTEVAENTSLIN
jgi:hypothetical protein